MEYEVFWSNSTRLRHKTNNVSRFEEQFSIDADVS